MPYDLRLAPTIEQIAADQAHLEGVWASALDEMKRSDDIYQGTYNIWKFFNPNAPEAVATRPQYHSGRGYALVKHAVDANMSVYPRWHREPVGKTQEHIAKADRIEKAMEAITRDAFLRSYNHPSKVTSKCLLAYNYAILFVGLDDGVLLDRPQAKRGENQDDFERREWEWESQRNGWNPIRFEAMTPGTVLMEPFRKNPPLALRNLSLYAYQLADMTTTKAEKKLGNEVYEFAGDPYEKVEITERWTASWLSVSTKGKLLWAEPNAWGFQPFIHTWAGAVSGLVGGELKPEDLVRQSMLHQTMDTLVMHDQAYVAHHQLLQRAAWAKTIYDGDAADAAKQLEGDIISGQENQWGVEKVPQLLPQSMQHLELLRTQLEETSYSLSMAGMQQTALDTATQAIIQSEASNRKIAAVREQQNHLYSLAGGHVLRLAVRLNQELPDMESLTIGKDTLNVKDIADNYRIEASFETVDPVVFQQMKQDAREELKLGLIDYAEYQRVARRENASAIRSGVVKDSIRLMPEVQAELQDTALREAGFEKLADERERARRLAALVGPDGAPLLPREPTNGRAPNGRTQPAV
mgnify:CR=1 FL=1